MVRSFKAMFRCCMRPLVKDDEVPFKDMAAEAPLKESLKGKQGANKASTAAIIV
jgi:hypothetical protein